MSLIDDITAEQEVIQIVASVFETMMGLAPTPIQTPWFAQIGRVTAAVHLTGPWNGTVLIEATTHQACQLAARFLSITPPQGVDNDVRDVLGELANMIGGNLRCTLAPGGMISTPTVVDGDSYNLHICNAGTREHVAFDCEYGPFFVTLVHKN